MNEHTAGANIGALIAPHKCVIEPVALAASTTTSATFDRTANGSPQSCVASVMNGAATGTPDSYTVIARVRHSDDDSTYTTLQTLTTITTDATNVALDVDLRGAKRYIKLDITSAFVNGSSPKALVAGQLIMGGFDTLPVT